MQLCIETPVLAIPQAMLDGWQAEGLMELLDQVSDMAVLFASVDMVVPSYREVVAHEVNGLLVPVKDATALANAIERLHLDPAWSRQLGLAVRERAIAEFDERIVIEKTLGVDGELVGCSAAIDVE